MDFFSKIKRGLGKTRDSIIGQIKNVIGNNSLDDDKLEELEEILITADLGVDLSLEIIERLRERSKNETVNYDNVLDVLFQELESTVEEVVEEEPQPVTQKPHVTFVIGVNGSGKTTTIGKLAHRYSEDGEKVLIIAADTFRSAAVEQLAVWAERAGVDIVRGATGADPGSVVYDGLQAAQSRKVDRVFVDTAGRLHTKVNLMKELEKLDRVAKKIIPDAPHDVLLVIDGTTGQNGLSQARSFSDVSSVNGLAVTKLDGTAKGGVIIAIGRELKIPVRWIGLGEGMDDLVPFDPKMVVRAIVQPVPETEDSIPEAETTPTEELNSTVPAEETGDNKTKEAELEEEKNEVVENEEEPAEDIPETDTIDGENMDINPIEDNSAPGDQKEETIEDASKKKKRAWWKFGG